ncbi:MAG: cytochrome b N-terminal domain-containing protein [Myxococcota bacterium]
MSGRLRAFADALDRRTGYRAMVRAAADEPVKGGARVSYVFGSALLFTFVLQALTGVALASAYSPSVTDAWGSVWYIQERMTLGWLVRGLHHFGSSAMIVLAILHMTQVFLHGAWRKPREANWVSGVVLLLLILAFGLTGYLLPWDQKGYWATQVATRIMGGVPGGVPLQEVLQGGAAYGNLTLTRFYALHVFILPGALTLLVVGHVALFRRYGVTPSPRRDPESLDRATQPFWPFQMLRDVVVSGVVLGLLVALAVGVGAGLEAPADPAGGYEARPEWYFLFLYQLLKYFEGPLVLIGTVVAPGLALAFLVAVPWLDRSPRGGPSLRVAVPLFGLLLGAGALTVTAKVEDAGNEAFQESRAEARVHAERARRWAGEGGIDADGHVVWYEAFRIFEEEGCASCHTEDPDDVEGPLLAGYGTPERLHRFLQDPDADDLFGGTVMEEAMPPFEGDEQERTALVSWLTSLGGGTPPHPELVPEGREVFLSHDCRDCHNDPKDGPGDDDWEYDAFGPDLDGYLGFEWVRGLVLAADHPAYFGGSLLEEHRERDMPAYPDLTPEELRLLTRWLRAGAPGAD